ncbi:MAG: hypothetical protein GX137_02855 [Thermoplasmatales archaeon]|jgi:hypothetical protein|nr:hypothetical protein [Thermoplasmatales archaeon]
MLNDRAIIILIAVALLVPASAAVFRSDDEGMTGIVSDVRETKNGYVFNMTVLDGTRIKCFISDSVPDDGATITVYGSFSGDGTIFFIDKMTEH